MTEVKVKYSAEFIASLVYSLEYRAYKHADKEKLAELAARNCINSLNISGDFLSDDT